MPLAGLSTRHARVLLARLAFSHPRPLTRAQLCADLFPDIPTENAARRLRTTLYYLRRALFDHLRTDHEHVTLNPALQVVHDVGKFERRIARGATPVDLRQAIELYRGPFLEASLEGRAMSEALRLHSIYIDARYACW